MAGALETHISSLSDSLISGMSFARSNTASYITARRSTAFQTQSGGTFSPANLRILRFNLSDGGEGAWMDGSVLRVALTLNNTGQSALTPTTNSPSSLIRRIRLLVGSTEVYDCLDSGRVHQLMTFQLPAARLMEDAIEGWGASDTASSPSTLSHAFTPEPIDPGTGEANDVADFVSFFFKRQNVALVPSRQLCA